MKNADVVALSRELYRLESVDELLRRIILRCRELCEADKVSVLLVDPQAGDLSFYKVLDEQGELIHKGRVRLDESSMAGRAMLRSETVLVADAAGEAHRYTASDATGDERRSMMAVPIIWDGEPIGAVEAMNKRGRQAFTASDAESLRLLADLAAMTLHHLTDFLGLRIFFSFALEFLADVSNAMAGEEARDPVRMAEQAVRLGRQLGFDRVQLKRLWQACYLHDIGRLGMLVQHRPYGPVEAARCGAALLHNLPMLAAVGDLLRLLHERHDGSGQPDHLEGDALPLEAQVLALVADYEDARRQAPEMSEGALTEYFVTRSGRRYAPRLLAELQRTAAAQPRVTAGRRPQP